MKYCPLCMKTLIMRQLDDNNRLVCPADDCNFVYWDNPVPVVAAIVEHDNKIILANNVAWPEHIFSLITGFLEKGESPEQAVVREVQEELGLTSAVGEFVGVYPFHQMNQLILAYHVKASGTIQLNEELRSYKRFKIDTIKPWNTATGAALQDWLTGQGVLPEQKISSAGARNKTKENKAYEKIYQAVRLVAKGQVATYGLIARLAGTNNPRQVGYALNALTHDTDVPWHRVINNQGKISARNKGNSHDLQKILLESEGIIFDRNDRTDLEKFIWSAPD